VHTPDHSWIELLAGHREYADDLEPNVHREASRFSCAHGNLLSAAETLSPAADTVMAVSAAGEGGQSR